MRARAAMVCAPSGGRSPEKVRCQEAALDRERVVDDLSCGYGPCSNATCCSWLSRPATAPPRATRRPYRPPPGLVRGRGRSAPRCGRNATPTASRPSPRCRLACLLRHRRSRRRPPADAPAARRRARGQAPGVRAGRVTRPSPSPTSCGTSRTRMTTSASSGITPSTSTTTTSARAISSRSSSARALARPARTSTPRAATPPYPPTTTTRGAALPPAEFGRAPRDARRPRASLRGTPRPERGASFVPPGPRPARPPLGNAHVSPGTLPSGATSRAAGRWISCSAAVVPGSSSSSPTPPRCRASTTNKDETRPSPTLLRRSLRSSAPSDGPRSRARPHHRWSRAKPGHLSRALLADARVVVARRDGTTAVRFDAVAPPGRRVVGVRRGGWRTRTRGFARSRTPPGRSAPEPAPRVPTRLDANAGRRTTGRRGGDRRQRSADTRGVGGTARVAVALAENLAEGRHTVSDDPERTRPSPGTKTRTWTGTGTGRDGTIRIRSVPVPRDHPGTERALVLHRYWKRVELGVSANFLFASRRARRRDAARERSSTWTRLPRRSVTSETTRVPHMVLRRSFEVRDAATPREPRESNPRASLLVLAGAGSSRRGAIFARFVFDTVADRSVFETLVGDLRGGTATRTITIFAGC